MVPSYTPTLTALLESRRNIQPVPLRDVSLLLVAEPSAPGLPPIEHVSDEISCISGICSSAGEGADDRIVVLEGANGANRRDVLERLPRASVLHLACHGQQDSWNALESGFCLRDGRLTVADLMRLKLPRPPLLAFLSACETAKGDERQPDQAVHLAAAMLFVGFRSTIATMWWVSRVIRHWFSADSVPNRGMGDKDGPLVAKIVYEEMWKGDTLDPYDIPFALDRAVGELRQLGVPASRWAPFIHIGA